MGAEQSKTVVIENPFELILTASAVKRIEKHHERKISEENIQLQQHPKEQKIKPQSEQCRVEENLSLLLDKSVARLESNLGTFQNRTQDMENRRRPPDQCQQLKALLTNCYKNNANNTLACAKEVDDFKLCLQLYCNDQLYHSISNNRL